MEFGNWQSGNNAKKGRKKAVNNGLIFFFLLLPLIAREQVEKTQILFEVQVYYPSSSRDLPWEVEELYAYIYVCNCSCGEEKPKF